MVADCFATCTALCIGSTLSVASSMTRSVMLAAAASVLIMSRFGYVTRSPQASTENGPASTRRIQSRSTSRVVPATIDGSATPIFTAATGVESALGADEQLAERRVLRRSRLLRQTE